MHIIPSQRGSPWQGSAIGFLLLCAPLGGCSAPASRHDLAYFPPPPAAPHAVHLKSFNSLGAIAASPRKTGDWFTGGGASAFVEKPLGIAYRGGHLYICDTAQHVVHDWDLNSGVGRRIVGPSDGFLQTPVAAAVDGAGNLYVADTGRSEVVVFDAAGQVLRSLKPRTAYRPVAVVVEGNGQLWVADAVAGQVDEFSVAGEVARSIPLSVKAKGGLPMGLALDASGRLFVCDMVGGRVLVFDKEGSLVSTIGQRGDRFGDLGQPRHLALGPDGVLFIADPEFAHVHLFNDQGQLLMLLGGPDHATAATPFPVGVAVADEIPTNLANLVPEGFHARYFLFVSNSFGENRLNLFAIGEAGAR